MKTSHIIIMMPLLLVLACEKPEPMILESEGQLCLSVDLGGSTKADNYTTEWSSERAVQSVGYYIFDSKGRLEAVWNTTSADAVSGKVSSGTKTVWAVVNFPSARFSDVTTLTQFESKEVSFADFGTSKFPMSGKKAGVYVGTGKVTFSITVERFVSRIFIAEIRNNLTGVLADASMTVKGVFLSNVAGNCKVTGDAPSTRLWYNRFGRIDGGLQGSIIRGWQDASYSDFTYGDTYDSILFQDECFDDCFALYFFPNPATSDVTGWSSTYTQRYTRVITAVEIEGETYYYPVNLVGTLRNHAYTLYLTITHLGTRDPDTFDYVTEQGVVIDIGGFDDWDNIMDIDY